MTGTKNKTGSIVATSITGPYHQSKGLACQDFFCCCIKKNRGIAVVSDGAGSAKYGKIGAKCICETLCQTLKTNLKTNIKQQIIDAVEIARSRLMFHRLNKTKDENGLIDFAATLVGVIYNQGKGLFFHIGDGAGIALFEEKNKFVISEPENGIFSSETFFYTMDDWKDSLRFTSFENAKNLFLMTDGVTGFALKKNSRDLEKAFLLPINTFLEQEKDIKRAQRALKNTLETQKAKALSQDDKTLLWIHIK